MLRLTQRDVSVIGLDPTQWFDVTVTETLEQIVRVEARSAEEAEQFVAKDWVKKEFVLDAESLLARSLWPCLLRLARTIRRWRESK